MSSTWTSRQWPGLMKMVSCDVTLPAKKAIRMSSPPIPSSEEIWEAYAESYDHILPILPFYQEAVRRHVSALTAASIRRVIDVGAGTGNVAVQLASRGVEVTAMDISSAMLAQLRRKKSCRAARIEIVEQD